MTIFQPYQPPQIPPPLAPSRTKTLERLIRVLEGSHDQHLFVEGKLGSGRHTLIHHLFAIAPTFKRKHRFTLRTEECATQLFEAHDGTLFFDQIQQFAAKHPRALVLVDNPIFLLDIADKTEERRFARFLKELVGKHDIRLIFPADLDVSIRLKGSSIIIRSQCSVIPLEQLHDQEVQTILTENAIPFSDRIISAAQRFIPHESAPGNAIRLWHQARQIAGQRQEKPQLQHAYEYISEQRGIPIEAVGGKTSDHLITLAEDIQAELIGQEHAVRTVSRVLTRAHAGFRNQSKPVASFLFLGPSGVGKTELAKILSRRLYQDQKSFHRIDMSEFTESHTVQRLIGAPPGYVGFEEGGQLTNPVNQEPYSLVLLDEIEKAHPKVFDVFLQLLDDGRLTDGRGQTVDFTHTTIVATSNIGVREIVDGTEDGSIQDNERFLTVSLLPLLLTHFRPEFLNRFDAIIVFQPLQISTLHKLCEREMSKLQSVLRKRDIQLVVQKETVRTLSEKAYQPTFGARPLKRMIEDTIESVIAERIVRGQLKAGDTVTF